MICKGQLRLIWPNITNMTRFSQTYGLIVTASPQTTAALGEIAQYWLCLSCDSHQSYTTNLSIQRRDWRFDRCKTINFGPNEQYWPRWCVTNKHNTGYGYSHETCPKKNDG